MAEEFFRPRPAQRRGSFKLVVDTLYWDASEDEEAATGFTFDKSVLETFVRRIYEKDFHPMTDIELQMFRTVWETLDIAADKGFGSREAHDPDADFYEELKRNNAVFAAFKVHRMQNDMAALLLDSNGHLKPFEQWAKEAMPIADHQVYQWLQTEYDTAVIRAHQAADWRQFEREKDVLPNLKWMPSTSLHPGADHRRFWGTIRPIETRSGTATGRATAGTASVPCRQPMNSPLPCPMPILPTNRRTGWRTIRARMQGCSRTSILIWPKPMPEQRTLWTN